MLTWITGASSGIGRALALELASRGYIVLASARRTEELDKLVAEDNRIIPLPLDVTDYAACKALVDKIEKKYGPIDLAIFNAGIFESDPISRLDRDVVERHFNVNVMGVVNTLYASLAGMLLRKRGHVVINASVVGYRGLPNSFSYGGTKAALINMAECLKLEMLPHRIRVQVINPGFVRTKMIENVTTRQFGTLSPEEAAKEIVKGIHMYEDFEIRLPGRFSWCMRMLRLLPNWMYFPIVAKITRPN